MIPLIKQLSEYMKKNYNPHTRIIISWDRYDIVQDLQWWPTDKLLERQPILVRCKCWYKSLVYEKKWFSYICPGCAISHGLDKWSIREDLI